MGQSTPLIVPVAALLINILSYCSAENVYCVTPTATSCSSCPRDTHCATLSEYAQEHELYFTSNTTMVFLPGDHVLDRSITVANVAGLTMHGESSLYIIATIVRNGSVGFSFTNMVDVNIHSLAFTFHNRSWSHGSHPASSSALFLHSTLYVKLVNCSFHDNLGTALAVHNTSITLAEDNEFIHNQCGCKRCKLGCGITALSSAVMFTGNTTFLKNSASWHSSGAIWASASSLHFSGINNFINNSAEYSGGAVLAEANTSLSFNGTSNLNQNSADYGSGGAIYTSHNVLLTFNGVNSFINNSGGYKGGAIYTSSNNVLSFIGTNNLISNSGFRGGGAIYVLSNSIYTFTGTNNFINNSAGYSGGGAIHAETTTSLSFNGTSNFNQNSARFGSGGAIYTSHNVVLTFNGTNSFINNSADINGGAIYTSSNNLPSFTGTNNFISNSVFHSGGAIYTSFNIFTSTGKSPNSKLTFTGTKNFINNSAKSYILSSGGAISGSYYGNIVLVFNGTNNFTGNTADWDGGAIYVQSNVLLIFIGASDFFNNSAGFSQGAIFVKDNVILTFNGINNFVNNSAISGGAIWASNNTLLSFTGITTFHSNFATLQGGAIFANKNSTLISNGSVSFTNNGNHINIFSSNYQVSHGGAMYLGIRSTFSIFPHTNVCWENNHATLGGAIYVSDINPLIDCTPVAPFIPREKCFFQLSDQKLSGGFNVQFVFRNNSAQDAGSVLYGGAIDKCKLTGLDLYRSGEVFNMLVHIEDNTDYNTTSNISSDSLHICPCKNNIPDCTRSRYYNVPVYPGETFQISVVAVGQREGTVSSTVRSTAATINTIDFHQVNLLDYQYLQQTNNTCTKLNYTVFSLSQEVKIELHPEGSSCFKYNGGLLTISVNLNQTCPPGFNISEVAKSCVCEPRLAKLTNQCNITNGLGQITRDPGQHFWVGYDLLSYELILHPHCPLDYCVNDVKIFPLNNTDLQCAYNRTGLLCGHCKKGYSLVLGTHRCMKCTNSHLALLIPFAVMGVALVFLLLVCKLTVATGTLSGLVFYANIVGVNRTIFLPVKSTHVLSVFIAWLNLDFGVETCFYNGMDAYSKTWLQSVFPVYIWMLVGLMILISYFSHRFANLLGNNPVSVLATLILLSYAKILRTFITAVYITHLEYLTYNRRVWFYDANVDYLIGKHIPLFFLVVLVFLFLFLPYTLLLLFGQWLQAISHLRIFSWVNRLKPFMDSYHAPYKAKHRYWPGLLLVFRFVLLLIFALNPWKDPNINLLAIFGGAGIIHLWAWLSGGVYKNWCLDVLEGLFVLNLVILSAANYLVSHSGGNQLAVGYTSVSIVLTTFIGILAYHIFQQLRHTKLWKKVPKLNLKFKKLNTKQDNLNNPINDPTESVNLDQLREPWLEDLLQPTHSSL